MSRTPDLMIAASTNRRASGGFFRQGLFILLPVAVLAMIGFYSLRQDRLLAEAEARQTAQRFADDIARTVWTRLRSSVRIEDPRWPFFCLDSQGRLLDPPP